MSQVRNKPSRVPAPLSVHFSRFLLVLLTFPAFAGFPLWAANTPTVTTLSVSPATSVPAGTILTLTATVTSGGSLSVHKALTTTAVTAPATSKAGTAFTVTFTVNPQYAGTPSGTVTVTSNDPLNTACSGTLAAGAGSCTMNITTKGTWTLTASYGGDSNFSGSSGTDQHHAN